MSLWDSIKSIAISAKCATGWHSGEFERVDGQPRCHYEKICPDCKEKITTRKHKFLDPKYISSGSCKQVKNCEYCEFSVEDTVHQYEFHNHDSNCRRMERCARCRLIRANGMDHSYDVQGKDTACREILRCRRCGHSDTGRSQHIWINVLGHDLRIGGKRKCKDCGAAG